MDLQRRDESIVRPIDLTVDGVNVDTFSSKERAIGINCRANERR